jgi:hypothetical protein
MTINLDEALIAFGSAIDSKDLRKFASLLTSPIFLVSRSDFFCF